MNFRWSACFFGIALAASAACEREAFVRQEPSQILVNTDLIDFGAVAVGGSLTRTLTFTTHGLDAVEVTQLNFDPADEIFGAEETAVTVEGNSNREVSLFYSPLSAGTHEGTLTIEADATNAKGLSVKLKGVAYEEFICGDCNSPPGNYCITATERLVYSHAGECVNGQCQYQGEIEECEFGCHEESGTCNGEPTECEQDADCSDGEFCNGSEVCNENICEPGVPPCSSDVPFCSEEIGACVACLEDYQCGDGLYCNGLELCTDYVCAPGMPPCLGNTPLCDEETEVCSGCEEEDPCSEICMAQCTGHCRCLNQGNNLCSAPFIFPNNDGSVETIFAHSLIGHIVGGKSLAARDNNGVWGGTMVDNGGILAEEAFWIYVDSHVDSDGGVTDRKIIWSVPGVPDFNREYHLYQSVDGLVLDCSEEGQECEGLLCGRNRKCAGLDANGNEVSCENNAECSALGLGACENFGTCPAPDGGLMNCTSHEECGAFGPCGDVYSCQNRVNWVSFPGLASQRVFDGSGELGAIPPEVAAKMTSIIGEGIAKFRQDDGSWIGNLTTFQPMRGYQIFVEEDVSFKFRIDTSLPENAPYAVE